MHCDINVIIPLRYRALRGLARYHVHTTVTLDPFWNIIKKVRNHSDGISLFSSWLIEYRSYKKIKSGTSHIAHHTSHITYYIWICKFYKILVINTVVTSKNSSKLTLKTFDEYFDNTNTYGRPKSSQTHHFTLKQGTFGKVWLNSKIIKKKPKACFFLKVIKKNWVTKNPKRSRSAFFQNAQRDVLGFFKI